MCSLLLVLMSLEVFSYYAVLLSVTNTLQTSAHSQHKSHLDKHSSSFCANLNHTIVFQALTWPNGSRWLLVSFSFWKDTSCLIQWAPVAGESGWTYSRPGIAGSALPVTDLSAKHKTHVHLLCRNKHILFIDFLDFYTHHMHHISLF